jgi:putative transposase
MQFTPKYRRPLFNYPEVQAVCRVMMEKKARTLGITIGAMEFGPDHVHLFLVGCKNYSASYLAGQLKGYVSYGLRKRCWNTIKRHLWGNHFWSDGYFFESVGRVTSDMVQFYIERQQRKHWQGDDYEYFKVRPTVGLTDQTSLTDFA